MRRIFFYKTLVVIALAASCKKVDLPDPVEGIPVFSADLLVDGVEVGMQAGVGDYYMFTSFEKGADDVYSFVGELKLEEGSCLVDCPPSLEIRIRDFQQVVQGPTEINTSLALGEYGFRSELFTGGGTWETDTAYLGYRVHLFADSSFATANSSTFHWNTGTGAGLFGATQMFEVNSLQPAPEVTLRYTEFSNFDSCESRQTQRIQLPNGPKCSISIEPVVQDSQLWQLQAIPTGSGFAGFQWMNGSVDSFLFGPALVGVPEYSVTTIGNCIASATYRPGEPPGYCRASFDYGVEELFEIDSTFVPGGDTLQLSTVTLIYTTSAGELYRSDLQDQTNISNFEILEVTDFDDNENGQATKKLSLRFNCALWNEVGEAIIFEPGSQAVFGVAYPE